mmetsp:Transcript_11033/g.20034  ORF Transcript_11033/g.20034 Transcript_11033/m.20034 type:complete len:223 (-) Transcript_11033:553-1221(-)|eukprot:CAMPEP_0175056022 /NCGR_PEP_ID=MMETSP0052_2-20121109/10424_1 /TAXON_ID=51329 ORGANISM="Polytomella parva, Strain SAG 63-3" /NCGR_SAMPLE_ID=MMETSP0052_2 /ASSEMBLY_ACC=CAM_ASM_000194 /LENGTH=222 /DNA_ID=CAMNT_0016320971 /DNA_START=50 /DNA_END=718 /DNA_ORIENTATION=-
MANEIAPNSSLFTRCESLSQNNTPEEIFNNLLEGNKRFVSGQFSRPHRNMDRVKALSQSQKPTATVLGCSDSRAPLELLFDQGYGDIFACRVAGNVASLEEIASIEYSVIDLGVRVIVVLGHTSCGAVKAAIANKILPGYLKQLMEQIQAAKILVERNQIIISNMGDLSEVNKVCIANVLYQLERVKRSSVIRDAMEAGKVKVVGCLYNIDDGTVIPLSSLS